jgi:hypothetical protein
MIQSEILNCQTIGTGKKPTRIGVSLSPYTLIDGFKAHNIQHAIYNDVAPVSDAIVRNSRFTGITYSGPWVIVDAPKKNILIENCEFEFAPREGREWIGMTIWDEENSGAMVSDVVLKNCTFRGRGSGRPFTPLSVKAKVENIRVTGNRMPRTRVRQAPQPGVLFEDGPVLE